MKLTKKDLNLSDSGPVEAARKALRQARREELAKVRPDLLEQVKAKSITLNEALIQAGLRKASISIPTSDLNEAASKIAQNFDLDDLIPLLQQQA